MTCDLLYPYHNNTNDWIQWTSKRFCLYNFNALPSATACFGDSGGPIVVCEDDRIVVIGVSSWGQGHCREEGVSVFVDVAMYVPWIRSKISEGNN